MDIEDKLDHFERKAAPLEPNQEQRQFWMEQVFNYADEFIDQIEQIKAYNFELGQGQGIAIDNQATDMAETLAIIKREIDGPGLNPASGGHLAYIPGGGIFPSALGDFLADITNRYAGIFHAGPGAVRMENALIRWMCGIIGFPKSALGNLTSGGSIATLIAITTARDAMEIRSQKVPTSVIYLTQQAHHSVQKALRIAGLQEAQWRYIPVDQRFRMDMKALKTMIQDDLAAGLNPFLLIGNAGTTDTGAIDPLAEQAALAHKHKIWYHVDAAYGGFFVLAPEVKNLFNGIESADSVTIDPHKGLFLPYGLGAVLVKNVEALQNSHYYKANYMQDVVANQDQPSPADLSPELTKHFRGMRLWLPLKLFGLDPFVAAIQEKIWLCRYFYDKIQKLGFSVGPYPELSVMIYRYETDEIDANSFNAALVDAVRRDGRVFLSSTTIEGTFWIRLAVLAFRTHRTTIDLCLKILQEKKEALLSQRLVDKPIK